MEKVLLSIVVASGLCAVSSHAARQFHVFNELKTWTEAQSYCREHYTDLATVDNMEDMNILNNMTRTVGDDVWIGLLKDSWKRSDGSNSSFRFWSTGEPSNRTGEDCVLANFGDSGRWYDRECGNNYPFICYSLTGVTTRQVFKLNLRVEDGQDLDDEAMKDALLEQVKQKLKDQGLEHVKVSFRKQADGKFFTKEEKETEKETTVCKKDEF